MPMTKRKVSALLMSCTAWRGFTKRASFVWLHFVPNGMKLRGHLGSALQRKAAGILSIERNDDQQTSVVNPHCSSIVKYQ
jgi:hypothetical protein